jgi:amino acid adenylation domain-containing protein/non-ribosomal peptide synthase protein (TIGR01720 family)
VLGIEPESIRLDDSFFRLGGDSIAAMKLVGEARRQGMQLSVADLFRHPKLVALASLNINSSDSTAEEEIAAFSLLGADADVARFRKEVAASCGADADLVEDVYPCSPLQEGLMSLTSKRSGDYIMQSVLELSSGVDEGVFRAAWEHVTRSIAILRTRMVQHSELGLLQAVVAEDMQWTEAEGLEEYLDKGKSASMGLGDPLARYAVVKEEQEGGDEKRWFVWTIHHALYDGWSLPRIIDAVEKAYSGDEVEQQKQPGFQAFIKHLGQQDPDEAAAYWQAALADCEATLFPALLPAVQQPVAEATVHYQCPALPKTASDTTTSTLIRAAWAILASRYTSSDDVVFGATVTGRNAPVAGIEAMLGPAIATVPVRVRVYKDQTVAAFLGSVQQQATEMIAYEQTGLQYISKMGPGARHACGFQTLVVVKPAHDGLAGDSALGRWRGGSELQGFTTYGLVVQCTLAAEGVGITASFDERVIERWLVERMLGQLSFVMQQLAAAAAHETATTTVGSINTLTAEDKQQLWEWNSEVPAAVERCVHDLFAEQAQARPDAPAICAWDGELTYGELDALSTKLAGHLVELGVKAEDMVPLCFEKSMWTVVAMLAVLKAGGAFVPLDPEHPESRHQEVFQQTAATVVLTSPRYSTLWASSARNIVTVDDISTKMLSGQILTRSKTTEPSNAAYVIFTSGSTGQPKGVVLEHRAVSTSCLSHRKAFRFTSQTRALQFASYTFDACITEIVTTLVFGGCVCVPSEDDRRNGLASVINSLSVNWSLLTPSVARLLNPSIVPTLKVLVMGGEQVLSSDWETWAGTVETVNAYGPAECCVCCTVYTDVQSFKSGAIGKSVASASWVMVSDNHNQLAPVGSVGELLVEGPILARGYLNDAEKTDAAFISDPTWLVEGGDGYLGRRGRLYKTGDLVRYDADGNLVYVGRKDSQVKVRGQRVELGEVEHHLRECMPEIQQLAVEVILPTGEGAHATLAAFLQLEDEARGTPLTNRLDNTELLAQVLFLRDVEEKMLGRLPGHMVPTVYFAVAELPTTTSGKTDRRQLREIGASFSAQQLAELRTASEGAKRAPSTEAERTMQQLWAQVLNIAADSIGLDDSFFRLGGDSITAMQLSASARKLHIHLSTRDIFQRKTIAELVRYATSSTPLHVPRLAEDLVDTPFGLSPIQELYLRLESTGRATFDQCFFLELRTQVALESLCTALKTLVQRHSMLRARFQKAAEGGWQQCISESTDTSLTVRHVRSHDLDEIVEAIRQSRSSLDIETGPVLSAVLFDKDMHQTLFIAVHHLVIDLVSWRVLLEELEDLLRDRTLSLMCSISFPSWHAVQAEYTARQQSLDTANAKISPSMWSYWGVQPDALSHRDTAVEQFVLDSRTTTALLGSCNDTLRTRPLELMIAALVHSFTTVFPDRDPPTVFNETHGRHSWDDSIDVTRTVGWFTSMFPVQVPNTNSGLFNAIRETKDCIRSFKHNGRSYFASQFVNKDTIEEFVSIFPVEMVFNYQGMYQQLERDQSLFKSMPIPDGCNPASGTEAAQFSLFTISASIVKGCAHVEVMYSGISKHQEQVRNWVQQYETTLIKIPDMLRGKSPAWTLSDFPLTFHSYKDLDYFQYNTLTKLGLELDNIEDVYPCSSMQEGMLISQSKDPETYWVCFVFEVTSTKATHVDCTRLQHAWRAVVRRHSLLRTLLVDNVPGTSGTTNVVLKDPEPSIAFVQATGDATTSELLSTRYNPMTQAGNLQHHFCICQSSDQRVYIRLDINHAIADAYSRDVVLRDLQTAYEADLDPKGPPFRNAVSYLLQQSQEEAKHYWIKHLDGAEPCYFPSMAEDEVADHRSEMLRVPDLDMDVIQAFCKTWEVTPATVIQTAWALVLSRYTGSTTPCFGNLSSGRDAPIEDINDMFGPLISMQTCRVHLHEQLTVIEALQLMQSDSVNAMAYQTLSLASVHNALQLGTTPLFNTALSIQSVSDRKTGRASEVVFHALGGADETEVSSCTTLKLISKAKICSIVRCYC